MGRTHFIKFIGKNHIYRTAINLGKYVNKLESKQKINKNIRHFYFRIFKINNMYVENNVCTQKYLHK